MEPVGRRVREKCRQVPSTTCKTASGKLLCDTGRPAQGPARMQRVGWRRGERKARERRLIHLVRQKPMQHCKAVILQLKNKHLAKLQRDREGAGGS